MDLMHVALGQPTGSIKPISARFERFIAEARRKYDLILIDCHPAGSIFTQTSLFNSDHVLIPVRPQPYAVRGLFLMLNFIKGRGARRAPVTPHVLFNHVPSVRTAPEEVQIRREPELSRYCMRSTLEYHSHFAYPSEGRGFVWN
jgi:chromosome partitioning protein